MPLIWPVDHNHPLSVVTEHSQQSFVAFVDLVKEGESLLIQKSLVADRDARVVCGAPLPITCAWLFNCETG